MCLNLALKWPSTVNHDIDIDIDTSIADCFGVAVEPGHGTMELRLCPPRPSTTTLQRANSHLPRRRIEQPRRGFLRRMPQRKSPSTHAHV